MDKKNRNRVVQLKQSLSDYLIKMFPHEAEGVVAADLGKGYIKAIYKADQKIQKIFLERNSGQPVKQIAEWLRREHLIAKSVFFSIKGHGTLIRYIPFAKIDKNKVREVFSYEIPKFIPFFREDIYFDVAVLNENYSEHEMLLLVAVAKKDFVDGLIQACVAEGITITSITFNNVSLLNLILRRDATQGVSPAVENAAIVDIGVDSTLINIVKGGIPCLSRETKISTLSFLHRLAKERGQSIEDVEKHIIHTQHAASLGESLQDFVLTVSEEIKGSFDYFEMNWGARIEKIYLTGGLAQVKGVDTMIGQDLGVIVERLNPFEQVSLEYNHQDIKDETVFTVAVGASL